MQKGKIIAAGASFSVLAAMVISGSVTVFIRNSGMLMLWCGERFGIDVLTEFSGVFKQLKYAQIRIPIITLFLLCGALFAIYWAVISKYSETRKRVVIGVCIILSLVLLLALFVLTLMFTEINTVRFGSALKAVLGFI